MRWRWLKGKRRADEEQYMRKGQWHGDCIGQRNKEEGAFVIPRPKTWKTDVDTVLEVFSIMMIDTW